MDKRSLADMPGVSVIINVEKCIDYLRGIGVEIDAETEARWNDAQNVHRWLRNEKRSKRSGYDMGCRQGHRWYGEWSVRSRKQREAAAMCPECGGRWSWQALRWDEARDGTIRDFRPVSDRWLPLDAPPDTKRGDMPGAAS